jgi:CubicO group peptidase (beta-lactamase class C family)
MISVQLHNFIPAFRGGWLFSILLIMGFAGACSEKKAHSQRLSQTDSLPDYDSIRMLYSPAEAARKAYQLDTFFKNLNHKHGFNGTVLIAQYGRVIYKGAFGYTNFKSKDTLTPQSSFQLASVSKQFTAMAIMRLKEKGLLSYEDEIQKFFPQFPYDSITIRHLLTHRSGLPNYMYEGDKHITDRHTPINNNQVISLLTEYQPEPYFAPGKRFNYSNTGYSLLASIVEKVAGAPFDQFMVTQFFKPLGMTGTFISKGKDSLLVSKVATGYTGGKRVVDISYLDGVVGDKGVYSTVEDLFKWDQALYTNQLVKQATLEEAFMPASKEMKSQNYGFGWRLRTIASGDPVIFHGGWWHGFKSYFMRNRKDLSTIIILTNVANSSLSHVKRMQAILYPEQSPADSLIPKPFESDTLKKRVILTKKEINPDPETED